MHEKLKLEKYFMQEGTGFFLVFVTHMTLSVKELQNKFFVFASA